MSTGNLRKQATELRSQGLSYGQILKRLNISSKGTLSGWFKNVALSPLAQKKLESNRSLATKRGLFTFNKKRTQRIESENQLATLEGRRLIGKITQRELFLIGAALYWGEGTKSELFVKYPRLTFTNSDPLMVSAYMCFLEKGLKLDKLQTRVGIHLYPSTDERAARLFWSTTTGIGPEKFYIVRQISRASKQRRKPNVLPYGTVAIKTRNRLLFYCE